MGVMINPSMVMADLTALKKMLGIDFANTNEDFALSMYIQWASDIIEEALDREFIYRSRKVVYQGTGTQKLRLRHRPVSPQTLNVIADEGANFGFAPGAFDSTGQLTLGVDYTIKVDQDDGTSREAILYRINDYWVRPIERENGMLSPFVGEDLGSYQVTYSAGYTLDSLPASLQMAVYFLIARIRYMMPLGMQLTSESYIERSIGLSENNRKFLLGFIEPFIIPWRNWTF